MSPDFARDSAFHSVLKHKPAAADEFQPGVVDEGVDVEPIGVVAEGDSNFIAGVQTFIEHEALAVGVATGAYEFNAGHAVSCHGGWLQAI
jgi:hypothetical protein